MASKKETSICREEDNEISHFAPQNYTSFNLTFLCYVQDVVERLRQQVTDCEDACAAATAAHEEVLVSAARSVAAVGRAMCEALPQLCTEEAAPQEPDCDACIDCQALLHLQVSIPH